MRTKKQNRFYIYLHITADTGRPFYVGKGMGNRANVVRGRTNYWKNIVTKHGFDVIMLETDLFEAESLERERYWISRIGRKDLGLGPLINFTDGGEGQSGRKMSEETKEKLRVANYGNKYSLGGVLS